MMMYIHVVAMFGCLGFYRYHRTQRRKRGPKEGGTAEDSVERAERLRAKVECMWGARDTT